MAWMRQGIGSRVAESMPEGLKQVDLAALVGMTPDALSRALSGARSFSSLEIARIADELSADLYWLITGEADPNRVVVAARHSYDSGSRQRSVPGWPGDATILEDIGMVYRQAEPALAQSPREPLPTDPAGIREILGDNFVRNLADLVEEVLSVDIVRLAGLSTAYSFTVGGRRVIAIPATGNWFWENWSIAHEYCHLARGHHEAGVADEAEANAFAAELLLPSQTVRSIDWCEIDSSRLAELVWDWGVSTDALLRRLQALGVPRSSEVDQLLLKKTQALLRHHWRQPNDEHGDAITLRMDAAASRRFPVALQEAHLAQIADGRLGKESLAWMLDVVPEDLEVEGPVPEEVALEELLGALNSETETP